MKPILFNTLMVQAILEGRKTSTRRIVKENVLEKFTNLNWNPNENIAYAPYRIGDILYVRETWCADINDKIFYRADGVTLGSYILEDEEYDYRWRPSIHMPKDLARIFLKVTDIKVQRLQDITEREAQEEGITEKASYDEYLQKFLNGPDDNYKYGFGKLWDSCGYKWPNSWSGNPYIWAIEFQRVEKRKVICPCTCNPCDRGDKDCNKCLREG